MDKKSEEVAGILFQNKQDWWVALDWVKPANIPGGAEARRLDIAPPGRDNSRTHESAKHAHAIRPWSRDFGRAA